MTACPAAAALILGSALALAGCSVSDPPSAAPSARTTAGCGDVAGLVEDHLDSFEVTTVDVDGQCTDIVIGTTLPEEDTAGGRRLCETAGEVAFTGDINSVTVRSAAGTELSVGIPGMRCLP